MVIKYFTMDHSYNFLIILKTSLFFSKSIFLTSYFLEKLLDAGIVSTKTYQLRSSS